MNENEPLPGKGSGSFGLDRFALVGGSDGAHGAGAGAGAAVDAGTGVDHHVLVTHGNRAHGAGALTCAAADASVVDRVCHKVHLRICYVANRYHSNITLQNCNRNF